MKPKLLVPRCYARTIDNPVEVDRLLSGDYLLAQPKARTKEASTKRAERRAMRDAGWQQLYFWLSPEDAAIVAAAKQSGESYAALLVRLSKQSLLS